MLDLKTQFYERYHKKMDISGYMKGQGPNATYKKYNQINQMEEAR